MSFFFPIEIILLSSPNILVTERGSVAFNSLILNRKQLSRNAIHRATESSSCNHWANDNICIQFTELKYKVFYVSYTLQPPSEITPSDHLLKCGDFFGFAVKAVPISIVTITSYFASFEISKSVTADYRIGW